MSQHRTLEADHKPHPEVVQLRSPAEPEPDLKPTKRRGLLYDRVVDKFLILLLPIIWFAYYSWRPIFCLRTDMPPQFVDAPAAAKPSERARQEELARRYWDLAQVLRWKFTKGSPLPADAPLEFRIDEQANKNPGHPPRTSAESSDSRIRYWHKLQSAWLQPDSWEERREWSTAWFTGPFVRFYVSVQDYTSNLVRIH